jgi:hypothetical protein
MAYLSKFDCDARRGEPGWLALVWEKVASLRYGVVQIVVRDGRVIQIERNEKKRLQTGRDGQTAE